jgi:hypothetical protein
MKNGARSGGVSCWPEAVQYLLGTYATPAAIRGAISDLRSLRQKWDEDEIAFAARVNQATYRCGNVHDEDEKMTFYVDGLLPCIKTLVARFRESEYRYHMTFERLMQHAKDEGDAFRSRNEHIRPAGRNTDVTPVRTRGATRRPTANSQPLAFLETDSIPTFQDTANDAEQVLVIPEDEPTTSIPTTDLPTTVGDDNDQAPQIDVEELLAFARNYGRTPHPRRPTSRVYPSPVPHDDRKRVGWANDKERNLICYGCYLRDHILPQCKHTLSDAKAIVANYESLTPDEKARVPDNFYQAALALIRGSPAQKLVADVQASQPKN